MNTDPTERGLVLAASVELLLIQTAELETVQKALADVDVPAADLVQAGIDKVRLALGYITNKYGSATPAA